MSELKQLVLHSFQVDLLFSYPCASKLILPLTIMDCLKSDVAGAYYIAEPWMYTRLGILKASDMPFLDRDLKSWQRAEEMTQEQAEHAVILKLDGTTTLKNITDKDARSIGLVQAVNPTWACPRWYNYLDRTNPSKECTFDNPLEAFKSFWQAVYGSWDGDNCVQVLEVTDVSMMMGLRGALRG